MVKALRRLGLKVIGTDIETGTDFLTCKTRDVFAVITNPPFDQEEEFIERALAMTRKRKGFVAMVARPGFSYAKTRYHLFAGCPCYAGKIEMTRRIEWFPRKPPDFNGPSEYHCWLLWDWRHRGPPVHLFYYEPKHMEAA